MAAVLCKGIGECCNSFGRVLCLPCKACGVGCDALSEVVCSPFFPYVVTTLALNVPNVVYGIMGFVVDSSGCDELARWLLIHAVLSAIHIFAAMYIVNRIREEVGITLTPATTGTENHDNNNNSRHPEEGAYQNSNFWSPRHTQDEGAGNSLQRIKHVLCYDKLVAVYILVFIAWIVWLCIGLERRVDDDGRDGGNCDDLEQYVTISISLGYAYLSLVGLAFLCSLCCLR